jgi:hypothetical protein
LSHFQIFIFGGFDTAKNIIYETEVFDSVTGTIQKVTDLQGNWVLILDVSYADGDSNCVIPIEEENAFVVTGGTYQQDMARSCF